MLKTEQQIKDWLLSMEGRKALQDAVDQAKIACASYREAARVDPATLNEPMTI